MPGNGAEPGLFISPERVQILHTVAIIDHNREPFNHGYSYIHYIKMLFVAHWI